MIPLANRSQTVLRNIQLEAMSGSQVVISFRGETIAIATRTTGRWILNAIGHDSASSLHSCKRFARATGSSLADWCTTASRSRHPINGLQALLPDRVITGDATTSPPTPPTLILYEKP